MEICQPGEVKPGELCCPRCHGRDIVNSMSRGIKDDIMFGKGRVPRHCRGCGKRFYTRDPSLAAGAGDEPLGE